MRETAPISSIFPMHFMTSYIYQTRTTTAFFMISLFHAPLKIILTVTVFVRTPRQHNHDKLSLSNFIKLIRELRLGYGANGIQSAINRVKNL